MSTENSVLFVNARLVDPLAKTESNGGCLRVEDGKITQRWAFSDDTGAITEFFAKLAAG